MGDRWETTWEIICNNIYKIIYIIKYEQIITHFYPLQKKAYSYKILSHKRF